jgi:hypothetical protein
MVAAEGRLVRKPISRAAAAGADRRAIGPMERHISCLAASVSHPGRHR